MFMYSVFSFFFLGSVLTHILHVLARKLLTHSYQLVLPPLSFPIEISILGGLLFAIPMAFYSNFTVASFLLIALLITVTITDLYAKLIPNCVLLIFSMPLLLMGPNVVAPFLAFFLFYLSTTIATFLFKKDTLGGGDVKLYMVIALVLDVQPLLRSILLASLLALTYLLFLVKKKPSSIPFAPFIGLATYMVHLGIL